MCEIEDCGREVNRDNLCFKHYIDWAWLAGLYEGEGSCYTYNDRYARVQIVMTDKDVLERVVAIAGGFLHGPYEPYQGSLDLSKAKASKPRWQWMVSASEDARDVLERLLPFMGDRRMSQILNVLDSTIRTYRECVVCEDDITHKQTDAIYCSHSCQQKAHRERRKTYATV